MTGFLEISSGSNSDEFIVYLNKVKLGFVDMIKTMRNVAYIVRENTIPITPFEEGHLGRSFKTKELANNTRNQIIEIEMSALNKRTGYDYAMTQHRGYHFNPKSGKTVYYNQKKPLSGGGVHMGGPQYLYKGIIESEDDAFILIEEDYLSLFKYGGFIY